MTIRIATGLLLGLALGAPAGAARPEDTADDLNAKVLAFARSNLGRKVGDGQCTTLAVEALRAAGARAMPTDAGDRDYAWGTPIAKSSEARPGDVVQFRDAVFRGDRVVRKNGRAVREFWRQGYPHHTAIVAAVRERGRVLDLLHQNAGLADGDEATRLVVQTGSIRLAELQKGGAVRIYRPVAP